MLYSDPRELNTLRHCCLSVQLNTIFTHFDRTLRTQPSAEKNIIAEGEVTLSKMIDWLIWEVPNATITLTIRELTPTLFNTLNTLLQRDNVPIGRPRTKLIQKIKLNTPYPTQENKIQEYKYLLTELRKQGKDRIKVRRLTGEFDNQQETLIITSDEPRRNIPIVIKVQGSLDQEIVPRLRKFHIQATKP